MSMEKLIGVLESGRYLHLDQIPEMIGDPDMDKETAELWHGLALQAHEKRQVEKVQDAVDVLTSLLNGGTVISGKQIMLQSLNRTHPFLIDLMFWSLLAALKQRCGRNGHWDGRISPVLQKLVDEYVV